ncbi:MAG: hypothetical protein C0594_16090 [Marinilabiliales bacterium]|nr:MAG: hypothetical protein C0594_16090 [Marinilabiliales bacterium]
MTDSWGDGWDGSHVDIYVNGIFEASHTCTASYSVDSILIPSGASVYLNYTELSSYPSEISYIFYNSDGVAVFSDGNSPQTINPVFGPEVLVCHDPDNPCTAPFLVLCTEGDTVDNSSASDSGIPAPSCGNYAGGDSWYSVIVPQSGELQVEAMSLGITDAAMAVYELTDGCTGTLNELICDDTSGVGLMPEVSYSGLNGGDTVLVRVWDNDNDETGSFVLQARDGGSLFCLSGNASESNNGCALLTENLNQQTGAIWDSDDKLDFTSDFSYDFTINIGNDDDGADGMAFVIQNDARGLSAFGNSGGELGAGGIEKSLIVEIDVYINTEDRDDGISGVLCSGGEEPDHMDIWLKGVVNPELGSSCVTDVGERIVSNGVALTDGPDYYNIENGLDHTFRVSYDVSTSTFTASILDAAANYLYGTISISSFDPISIFGTTTPYFGFTASTGDISNQHMACLAKEFYNPLPVRLLSFTGECRNEGCALTWTTASETNNQYFIIERSWDAKDYISIGIEPGNGNTNDVSVYSFNDNYNNASAYYRLVQVDYSGKKTYSYPVYVNCEAFTELEAEVYPNPCNGKLFLRLGQDIDELLVYNSFGQLVKSDQKVSKGVHSYNLDDLSGDLYSIVLKYNNVVERLSFIKL